MRASLVDQSMNRKHMMSIPRTFLPLALLTSLSLSPLAAQQRSVNTVKPEITDVRLTTTQPATLEAYYTANMGAQVSGVVESVMADIGQPVKKGDVLATLAVPDLKAQEKALIAERKVSETQVVAKEAQLRAVRAETDRILDLVQKRSITDKAGDEASEKLASAQADYAAAAARLEAMTARLEEVRARIDFATLRAPFDGIVAHRGISPGDLIEADKLGMNGKPLFRIVQTDTLRAVMFVPERDTTLLDVGDPLTLNFDALPGKRIEATVTRMAQALDPATQRMRVEADIETGDTKLRPGFYGSAEILLDERKGAITVPATALRFSGTKPLVYVVDGGNIAHRPIEIGIDHGVWLEVISGLQGNEIVVVGTVDRLPEGRAVSIR